MDKLTELIIIVAAGVCGYVLASRYFRRARPAAGDLERVAPPAATVTAAEMDELNRAARTKRQACLPWTW